MFVDREIGWSGRGRYRKFTARIPNDGAHRTPGNYVVQKNFATSVIDEWLDDEGLFTQEEFNAIWFCAEMWRRLDQTAMGERQGSRSLYRISNIKRQFPWSEWSVFENVIRWNEPTGVHGSRISVIRASSLEAAKQIVKKVAGRIYDASFFGQA